MSGYADRSLLVWLVVLGTCGLWLTLLYVVRDWAPLIPLGLVGMVGAGMLLWQVGIGKRWAMLTFSAIATFWVASSFRTRLAGDVSLDWQNGLKFTIWCGFFAVGLFNIRRLATYLTDPVIFCVLVYLALALCSVVYSEAPAVTIVTLFIILSYWMFACVMVDTLPVRDVMLVMTGACAAFCLASLLSAVVYPDLAFPQTIGIGETESDLLRLQGIAGHPNQLGNVAKIYMLFLIGTVSMGYLRRMIWIPLALMGLITIAASQSRTALAVLFIAGAARFPKRIVLPIAAVVAMLAISIYVSGETATIMRMISRDGSAQEAESMSGRTELWELTERLIAARPLLGYGLGSFETYAQIAWTGETRSDLVQPHNNYLSLLYNSGILGAIPWVVAFIILLHRWYTIPFLPRDIFVVAILVTGYSEADLPTNSIMPTLSFFLVLALDARRCQGLERRSMALGDFRRTQYG